jgi:hypothetical protein
MNNIFLPLNLCFAKVYPANRLINTVNITAELATILLFKKYLPKGAIFKAVLKFDHAGFFGKSAGGLKNSSLEGLRAVDNIQKKGNIITIAAPSRNIKANLSFKASLFRIIHYLLSIA